jgi:glyoxylase-like metal-dependent hydrolase (beta-lactamase superfamily II)
MCKKGFVVFLLLASAAWARTPKEVVDDAGRAMGAADLKSIQYSGSGSWFFLGQEFRAGDPWPKFTLKSYSRVVDYGKGAMRDESVRAQFLNPWSGGGFQPWIADQRDIGYLSGDIAWNPGPDGAPRSAPGSVQERQVQLAITPHGWVKAAMASNPTMTSGKLDGKPVTVVSFTFNGKYKIKGYINDQNLLEKVETRLPNRVLADMLVEATYKDYRDFSGVKFPTKIVQKQGGFPVLDLNVSEVEPNAPAQIEVPAAVSRARGAAPPAVRVDSQKLADGVWYVGGDTRSTAVEFKDYVAVFEGYGNEELALATIAEVRKLVPNKPIRYLINSHHHFDHSSGVRTYVAEGATIITHEINKPFWENAFRAPCDLLADKLCQNPKTATFKTVKEKFVLTDGVRTLEVHHLQGSQHDAGFLIAYLPNEKLVMEGDAAIASLAPNLPAGPNPFVIKNFQENLERLKLDVERIAPVHGGVVVPLEEVRKTPPRVQ